MDSQIDKMVGLEVGGGVVRALVLKLEKGRWRVDRFSEIPIGKSGEAPLREACFEAIGEVGSALVITSLPPADLLVRQLDIPVSKEREIQAVRDFQVEPLLPFKLEEGVIDHEVLERSGEGVRLAVLAVLKERIAHHLEVMKGAGIEPERISCAPVALARLLAHLVPTDEPVGVLHLGADTTACLVVRRGVVARSRILSRGASYLREGLPKGAPFEPMGRAEAFRAEAAKTFYSITHQGREPIGQIFVTGEFDTFRNLDVFLGEALEQPIAHLPQRTPLCDHELRTGRYAVPLGLLLDHLPKGKEEGRPIDFRQGPFAYPRPWRRAKKRIALYAAMALLAALLILGGGEGIVRKRERSLHALYGSLAPGKENIELLLQGVQARYRQLAKEVEGYPLKPDLPGVSEVMGWLESHPQMEGVAVDSFHYSLAKRPDHRNPGEPYQAKVELQLRTGSPTQARELHDALRAPNPMIDGSREIQWAAKGDRVQASFLLKDRTRYPGRTK
ncbi:MAG: hypothetical protein AB7F31_02185 [Parachlamydiales bacterium]